MAKQQGKYSRSRRDEEELVRAYRKISGPAKRSKKAKKSNRTLGIIAVCFAAIAIITGIAAGYFYFINADLDGIILDNVHVAGVDVGGMTQAQAIDAVRAKAGSYATTPMIVQVLDSQAVIPPGCVENLDVRGAVKAAYKFGNSGSQSKRQEEQQIALSSGYTVDLTPYLRVKETNIRSILADLGSNYNTTLSQSKWEVTGSAPNQKLIVKLGVPEYGLDLNKLYYQVMDAYSKNSFFVEGSCGMINPDPIDLGVIEKKYFVAPVNASFDQKTYEIIDGKDGYGFNISEAEETLSKAKFGTTVEIPFTKIAPEVTKETLSTILYRDTLATYTAEYKSNTDRNVNLRLACEAINGKVLYPGEVFSYNNTLGERTAKRGYRLGPSFSGDKTVLTYGGGICQVSSALYYCTLIAELETLVRENHGFAPSYMPLGMDATVSWGSIDFRFRNTSSYPIRIEAAATNGNVTVSIIGTDDKDYYLEMEYETTNKQDYSVTYQNMSADNPQGFKNGDYIVEPYTGCTVKTYRCKYDKETKELLSRDFIEQSVYRKRDGVICQIGFGGGNISDGDGALPPE